MANYKLVSDSTSNLFDMEGINYAYVPMKINCGGVEFVDTPALDLKNMEAQLNKGNDRFEAMDTGNRITQRAILALLDHGIDGNNIRQMQDAKEELQNHLINR